MDLEIHMIQNERIDEISTVINQDFDKLLELQDTDVWRQMRLFTNK